MKKSMLTIAVAALLATGSASSVALAADRDQLRNELEIMTSILNTSLEQQHGDNKQMRRIGNMTYSYLEGQGVVYKAAGFRNLVNQFSFSGDERSMPPMPPVPDMPEVAGIDVQAAAEEGMRVAHEVIMNLQHDGIFIARHDGAYANDELREQAEELRDLTRELRDLSWELRELDRDIRDMNFELRNAPTDEHEELQQELAGLENSRQSLQQQQESVQSQVDSISAERAERVAKQQQQRAQQQQQLLTSFEATLAKVLCNYGNTLRSLPSDEHITVVLEGIGEPNQRNQKDRIYVFEKKAVSKCANNGDSSELISQSLSYYF
ncbi:MAG: hypothetical protein WEA82_05855 [Idiomarina sp.]